MGSTIDSDYALALALQEDDVYITGEDSIPSTTRSEMSTDSDLAFALALQNDDDVYITSIEEGSSTASTARSTDSDFAFALALQETDTFVTDVDKISPKIEVKTELKDPDFAYRDDDDDDDVCITGVVNMPPRAKVKAEPSIDDDFALALSIQDENKYKIEAPKKENSGPSLKPIPITDPEWENVDPVPDVRSLFLQFNKEYFWGTLSGIEVKWSDRMTRCAGLCCYEGQGGLCSIRLSLPLLKFRPRKDLVETLLHEMIHAYLFVTANNKDHDAHGEEFHKHMNRINKLTGSHITVFHNFVAEVDHYLTHWWQCNGSCRHRAPYFGIVKRSMNRAPGPNDPWYSEHQRICGGSFTKIQEPSEYKEKQGIKRKSSTTIQSSPAKRLSYDNSASFVPFTGTGHVLGTKQGTIPSSTATSSSRFTPTKQRVLPLPNGSSSIQSTINDFFQKSTELSSPSPSPMEFLVKREKPKSKPNCVPLSQLTGKSDSRSVSRRKTNSWRRNPTKFYFLDSDDESEEEAEETENVQENESSSDCKFFPCPNCFVKMSMGKINGHLDMCLAL